MLAVADRQQGFFDAAWCSDLLPEDSIYSLLAQHGDRIVRDEDSPDCYSECQGRPSIPPSLLARVLLLAYRDGLSDERAMEALRFDLRWKVALDLPVDHPGFHPTSLVRFRARLLLHGKERLVFERSLELATELGLIEGEAEQIVDSTPMLGAAAVQDTATLVRSGVPKHLDAVRATDAEAAEELTSGLCFDYSRPRVKPGGRLAASGRSHGAAGRGCKGRRCDGNGGPPQDPLQQAAVSPPGPPQRHDPDPSSAIPAGMESRPVKSSPEGRSSSCSKRPRCRRRFRSSRPTARLPREPGHAHARTQPSPSRARPAAPSR
jgi:transposase